MRSPHLYEVGWRWRRARLRGKPLAWIWERSDVPPFMSILGHLRIFSWIFIGLFYKKSKELENNNPSRMRGVILSWKSSFSAKKGKKLFFEACCYYINNFVYWEIPSSIFFFKNSFKNFICYFIIKSSFIYIWSCIGFYCFKSV